jgi:Spy/CpxP family protein refolding chaperone
MAAAALSATLVLAQGHGDRPSGPPDPARMIEMRVNFLASRLSLTDDQKAKATTIFTNAQTASQDIRANLRTTRDALLAAVKKNDTAAIDQLSATLGAQNGQLTAIDSKADAAFYALLTADQQAKYDEMPRGPGGPGMGPAGFGRRR